MDEEIDAWFEAELALIIADMAARQGERRLLLESLGLDESVIAELAGTKPN